MMKKDIAQNHPQNHLEIRPILQPKDLLIPPKGWNWLSLSLSLSLSPSLSTPNSS